MQVVSAATRQLLFLIAAACLLSAQPPAPVRSFVSANCAPCHNANLKSGNLDLTSLPFDVGNAANFAIWARIHDRVRDGEMPPVKTPTLTPAARASFLTALATPLIAADRARYAAEGRATLRRMSRYEYENTVRDLLGAHWLQIRELLPEDGEAWHYNKSGEALDVSHVHMNQYLSAAEYALREVLPNTTSRPETATKRYYARDQNSMFGKVDFPNTPERNMFPVVGDAADMGVLKKTGPKTVGPENPEIREQEGLGVVASTYEPLEMRFNQFKAPVAGRYKLRLKSHTMWVGPQKGPKWWKPDPEQISAGRTQEPVTLYSEVPPREMRRLGSFDVRPEPTVNEIEVYLLKGESVRPDAVRFFRSRPPGSWRNPLATEEGQPGVVFNWLEVEGPLVDQWPTPGNRLLFGDLPYTVNAKGAADFQTKDAASDSRRLLKGFLERAYRHPVPEGDVERFAGLVTKSMASGYSFTDAMIAAYTAVLCSPAFVTLEEKPGHLDGYALASRLSYFLWNSEPDAALRELAAKNQLQDPAVLRAQTKRMLDDPKSQRFVQAFLDYWLDLRKIDNTSPDTLLYPEYYLDDFFVESAGDETRAFFTELIRKDLPATNIVSSDFAMLNERLAALYVIPGVTGAAIRRVPLPADSPRGGILTQASVLKVTANGTTTSPVLRGVWINERILGKPVPPRPANVPAVDTDTRGATTIREQLAKHRSQPVCSSCHALIDPAGFALESFDVVGGYRDRYRALGDGPKEFGFGKGGQPYEFHFALPVDASGTLPDGRTFADVRELKRLLLTDERQIARNLASQLITYATGAPVRFGDRPQLEAALDKVSAGGYGVESIIQAVIGSDLFRSK
jgi:mono/diheme cytochrome c family protein